MEPEESNVAPVLIVSPDERWLRALEVTIRLGGHRTVSRRSVSDALRVREGDTPPRVIVFDLGVQWTEQELETVRAQLVESTVPVIVILPEHLVDERDRIVAAGATVLSRPYPPSALYAALASRETDCGEVAVPPPDAPVLNRAKPVRPVRRRAPADPPGPAG